jgi:hypothetical protein
VPAHITHRLNQAELERLLRSPNGAVARDLLRRGLRVETQAKINLGGVDGPKRVDTGRLRASVATQLITLHGWPAVRVGTNVSYAIYVHEGTGIYGPRGAPIRPVNARVLRFVPRGQTQPVYAHQVRGMQPNHFLTNALRAARG